MRYLEGQFVAAINIVARHASMPPTDLKIGYRGIHQAMLLSQCPYERNFLVAGAKRSVIDDFGRRTDHQDHSRIRPVDQPLTSVTQLRDCERRRFHGY
jgi:hypothetical protein